VGTREFQQQAEQLDDSLSKREHVRPAPGVRATPALQAAQRAVLAMAGGAPATAGATVAGAAPPRPALSSTVATASGVTGGAAVGGAAVGGPTVGGAATVASPPAPLRRAALRPCPACAGLLELRDYEGMRVATCPACGGRFLAGADVARVVARREVGFTPRQQALAEGIVAAGNDLRKAAVAARFAPKEGLRPCPRCGRIMARRHYSYDVAVDVDYCGACEAYWFDCDELEVVQIVAEQRLRG
jgi:Zn-finger nucleic acid-binding protein